MNEKNISFYIVMIGKKINGIMKVFTPTVKKVPVISSVLITFFVIFMKEVKNVSLYGEIYSMA